MFMRSYLIIALLHHTILFDIKFVSLNLIFPCKTTKTQFEVMFTNIYCNVENSMF